LKKRAFFKEPVDLANFARQPSKFSNSTDLNRGFKISTDLNREKISTDLNRGFKMLFARSKVCNWLRSGHLNVV
jgi:hypothetical protein